VVEILSPGTEHYDRELKRKVYAQTGVKELWLIDPDAKEIRIHPLNPKGRKPALIHGAEAQFRSALLPGLLIRAEKVFRPSRLG
jgi:Uma2 family endonuclease